MSPPERTCISRRYCDHIGNMKFLIGQIGYALIESEKFVAIMATLKKTFNRNYPHGLLNVPNKTISWYGRHFVTKFWTL